MRFINTLREGDRINDVYFCKQRNTLSTKTGREYDSLILQDKTGILDGKIWETTSEGIGDYDEFSFVYVTGEIVLFNGALQANIKRIRMADETEYDEGEYFPRTDRDIDEMKQELRDLISSVNNEYLGKLLEKVFTDATIDAYAKHSAAKSVHHAFIGGLLEHTLSVARTCDFFSKNYEMLNRDLLITAAIMHDIGKLKELSAFPANDYTDEGQLLGHIVIGAQIVSNMADSIEGFPKKLKSELMHCILAHHGELEWGSPKKPAICEAMALHFADNVDAKLETMKEVLNGSNEEGWLGFNKFLDSNIRKTTKYE